MNDRSTSNTHCSETALQQWREKYGVEEDSFFGELQFGLSSAFFEFPTIVWSPTEIPENGQSLLIASSRLGRRPDQKPNWFDALRTSVSKLDSDHQFLITGESTTANLYLHRLADLFQIPIVEFRPFPKRISKTWFEQQFEAAESWPHWRRIVYFSPLDDSGIDDVLMRIAKSVRLLSVSGKGNIHRSVMSRLQIAERANQTWLLCDEHLTAPKVQQELIDAGASRWLLYRDEQLYEGTSSQTTGEYKSVSIKSLNLEDYLLHWTRQQTGPWPNQSEHQFVDDLIFGSTSAAHDRLSTICRILATGRLIASNRLTRDSTPVVCFSGVAVDRLPELRVFRSHLGRWDFETIGIAIRRSVLVSLGAKKVIYGDQATWENMPADQRPFFQLEKSENKSGQIDWSREQEWRLAGDLELNRLNTDDAFLFVSNAEEATTVASYSRWPILNLTETK